MLLLLLALGSQVPAPCPQAAAAARETSAGWRAYRREAIGEAAAHFAVADSPCPGDHGAQVGAGFVRFRQGGARGARVRIFPGVGRQTGAARARGRGGTWPARPGPR